MAQKPKTDNTAMNALKKDLKDGTLGRLYVFHGEEAYLRDYYLGEMKKKLLPQGLEEFNFHTAGKDMTVQWLSQALDALPMMSERTLVVVTDFDLFGGAADVRDAVMELLGEVPEYCCLVFVYDLLDYKPDARTKMAAALKKNACVVPFRRQEQGDLVDWIIRRFRALDHDIDSEDARYLIFLCGDLMNNLVSEIGKIGAYAKNRKVRREEIDAVAIPLVDAVVFSMNDAIAGKNFDKAASILGDLLSTQESPIMILSVVGKYFRQLYSARLALEAGQGTRYLMDLWDMRSPYQAERLLDAARGYSLPWCRGAVARCAETDLLMKSSGGDNEEQLITLLMELANAKRSAG